MNEDYVSYEVAKLLNKKGFDINTGTFYGNGGVLYHGSLAFHSCIRKEYGSYPAPPLHMAQKWLRETYAIYIVVKPHYSEKYEIVEFEYEIYSYDGMVIDKSAPIKSEEYYEFFTECMNNAILEALKLI